VVRLLTLGKASIELHCAEHQLRRLCDQQRIPFSRAGKYRLFDAADLPAIREALIHAGYLKPDSGEGEAGG
jgi:hypothetical protein